MAARAIDGRKDVLMKTDDHFGAPGCKRLFGVCFFYGRRAREMSVFAPRAIIAGAGKEQERQNEKEGDFKKHS